MKKVAEQMAQQKGWGMANSSPDVQEGVGGTIKMAGMILVAAAVPVGARFALHEVKRHNGIWAIAVCVAIIVAMSSVGFILIWVGNGIRTGSWWTRENEG